MNIVQNVSLEKFTTFGIGGEAKYFVSVRSVEEMKQALFFSKEKNISYFLLGKGSNTLFDDRGYNGLVIQNRIDFCKIEETSVEVGSGYSFSHLGSKTAKNNLSGLEFACGIPATVGGAVFMNAGANGQSTWDVLQKFSYFDENLILQTQHKKSFPHSYRYSFFQETKFVILSAFFHLKKALAAKEFQKEQISYRTTTQPYGEKSAGCIFQNPPDNYAGALIDLCRLKGTTIGKAKVSETHANFIVTEKGATSKDIHTLIQLIKKTVLEEVGIELKSEIRIVPYES